MSPTYRYPRPMTTVDVVLWAMPGDDLEVLLIERKYEPFQGSWALPGGFLNLDEELEIAARRELREETGIEIAELEEVGTFGKIGRDPRGRTISVVYMAACSSSLPAVAGDDAASARWFPLHDLPSLAFDHDEIVAQAHRRLGELAGRQPIAFELLPDTFTLERIRWVYERVQDRVLDRDFGDQLVSSGVLELANRRTADVAALYRLSSSE